MFLPLLLSTLFGVFAGIFTGLIPGIHINLIALLLFIYSGALLTHTFPIVLAVFIVSMSITHSFLDFIPSIFLGAPEESTALSILPGHSLLLEGRGYEAVKLATIGGYLGIILVLLLTPVLVLILPQIYKYLEKFIPFLLILASGFLILKEQQGKRLLSLVLFVTSGILGILTLNLMVIKEPLFPLLTGLFGTSIIISSIYKKTSVPEQELKSQKIDKRDIFDALKGGIISGPACSFLPGMGAAQAAVLGSSLSKNERKPFLILLGVISTLVAGLNFVALYAINKPRSGTSIIVGRLIEIDAFSLGAVLSAMLISGSISVLLSLYFARIFAKNVTKINYSRINLGVLAFLVLLSVVISGPYSLIVLITSTSIGLLASEWGIKKMHLMGCLILPVIFYFLL